LTCSWITGGLLHIYIYIYTRARAHTHTHTHTHTHMYMPIPNVDRGQHRDVTEGLLSYGRHPRTQDTSLSYRMATKGSFHWIKRKDCQINGTPGSTAEVKNARCYTCTPPSVFTSLRLIAQGDKHTVSPKSDPSQTAANPAIYTSIRHEEFPQLPQTDAVCLQ